MKSKFALAALILSTLSPSLSTAVAQGTAFTYQGRLTSGSGVANGSYDLRFTLFDAASAGAPQGNVLTNFATSISNGLFTVTLDFGSQFPGADRWLEIAVSTNGANAFTALAPRQQITSTPYAVQAANAATAASANSVAAANITGTIPAGLLPVSVVTNGQSGVNIAGTFAGNGSGLINIVTASNLAPSSLYASNGFPMVIATNIYSSAGLYAFQVPTNAGRMVVKLWGAGGGGNGGAGAYAQVTLNVTPGEIYDVIVGQAGNGVNGGGTFSESAAGGQGISGYSSGGGQGSSLIRYVPPYYYYDIGHYITKAVAGGGGGGGTFSGAGGWIGAVGQNYSTNATTIGVAYLYQLGGSGQNGYSYSSGFFSYTYLGGGGGGYGGGNAGGGGGSYGDLTIPANYGSPANTADANYVAGSAGPNQDGAAVVIFYSITPVAYLPETVQAVSFIGNGSGLTGLNPTNLTSGTAAINISGSAALAANVVPGIGITNAFITGATIAGDGSGIMNVNAANLAGTLADVRLSTNVALLNTIQVFTGQKSFATNVGIGTANPQGALHVYSSDNPTVVRVQSAGMPGFGRLEFVSNPQGDVNEWRPAYIQSTDAGGFTGGLAFCLNGSGSGSKFGSNEVMRMVNGAVGINTNNPQAALHVRGNVLVDGADRVQLKALRTELSSNSMASGFLSVAMGGGTASGNQSVAAGASAASGIAASAFGNSTASGDVSFAANLAQATNLYATAFGVGLAGGWLSTALGAGSASGSVSVAMGDTTVASGYAATAIGSFTVAAGTNSFAAGNQANANHQGTFVWADNSGTPFSSSANNQFLIRASGGVGIGTASPSKPLVVQKRLQSEPAIMVGGAMPGGPRIQTYGLDADAAAWMGLGCDMSGGPYEHCLYFPVGNNNGRFTIGSYNGTTYSTKLTVNVNGNVGINTNNPQAPLHVAGSIIWGNGSMLSSDANGIIELGSPTSAAQQPIIDFHFGVITNQDYNVRIINETNEMLSIYRASSPSYMARFNSSGLYVNGTFVSSSDRNVKENFKPISAGSVLEKVIALPISHWNYKEDKTQQHIGPMAQDFYAAFKVGPDDKHITTVDEGGVALAAIQGLNQKLENENAAKDAEIAELKARLEKLERLLEQKRRD